MDKQEEMYRLLSEYRQSGQAAKTFCAANQIRYSTFQYWIRKERQRKESAFVPVSTDDSYRSRGIDLVYPNGVQIHLGHFDLNQISRLIKLQ